MSTALVICSNQACAKPLALDARFCPFCRTEQPLPNSQTTASAIPGGSRFVYAGGPDEGNQDRESSQDIPRGTGTLLIRPSDTIWHVEEKEQPVPYGWPRPLLIADEQATHLAHTDKVLTPEELLVRARATLSAQQVPVTVQLQKVRWQRDPGSPRLRLVAALKNPACSHLRLLFGVDYLGKWASLQMQLAYVPEPMPGSGALLLRLFGWICLLGGICTFLAQFAGFFGGYDYRNINPFSNAPQAGLGLSVTACIAGFILLGQAKRVERREERERAQRLAQRLARTFAVDDIRLFCSAMQEVYQSIVDDIVRQGGEVTRIEGGHGGFFQGQGVTQAVPPTRQSDAARMAV